MRLIHVVQMLWMTNVKRKQFLVQFNVLFLLNVCFFRLQLVEKVLGPIRFILHIGVSSHGNGLLFIIQSDSKHVVGVTRGRCFILS